MRILLAGVVLWAAAADGWGQGAADFKVEPRLAGPAAVANSTGSSLWLAPGSGSDIRIPPAFSRRSALASLRIQTVDAVDGYAVRVAYIIPSNRVPQPNGIANLRHALLMYQDWYREQMERHGLGPKTFRLELEEDGVTPKIYTVTVSETDEYLRENIWERTIAAAQNAGVPAWTPTQVWWLIPEIHMEAPDGSIIGGTALGGSFGSGDDPGVAVVVSDALARLQPDYLTNDEPYEGQIIAGIGPYPLVQSVSFPWFEGTTFSSISSSVFGAGLHEISHAFGLPHDFRNDQNFNGNLMGNGLRGLRGNIDANHYPSDYTRVTYGAALALSVSRYFNPTGTFEDNTKPNLVVSTTGGVSPVNGLLRIDFDASDPSGLVAAWLQSEGNLVEEMVLSGDRATRTFTTPYYSPDQNNHYTVSVFDAQGNKATSDMTIFPFARLNQAPVPFVTVSSQTATLGKTVVFDASLSSDPGGNVAELQMEWDLNGDGIFEIGPAPAGSLEYQFTIPGNWLTRARLRDSFGAESVSAPIVVGVFASSVVRRAVFYNHSAFDGNNAAADASDDGAIALDKAPLLPGQTATFANYTSQSRGINGIMVDIAGLAATPTTDDFIFRIGNDDHPAGWAAQQIPPSSITVRSGAGTDGSDRVTIIWPDNAIQKTWLQVIVRATANTGLSADDVFYFGNAIGECGNDPSNAIVNVTDVALTRANPRSPLNPAPIDFRYDYDRDGLVNVTDIAIARANQTSPLTALQLITVP